MKGGVIVAKTTKSSIREANNILNAFAEGIKDKATMDKPTKPRKLNKMTDTIDDLRREFVLDRKGKMDVDRTIEAYETVFNRLQDFIGFQIASETEKSTWKGDYNDYVDNFKDEMRKTGGKAPIAILETPNFVSYFKDFLENSKGLSEQTVLTSLRHLRAIIYFAQENKWIKDFKIKIKDIKPPLKSVYTTVELQKLVRTPKSDDFVEYRNWLMIKYIMATANRISSVLALKVEDVDFESNIIRVQIAKNRTPKNYRMNPQLRLPMKHFIDDFHRDEEGNLLLDRYLFSNRFGGQLSYTSCRQAMARYFEARGVDFGGFHKFRYTYASNWIKGNGDAFTLKEQLGHSSLTMTNRYVEVFGVAHNQEIDEHSLIAKVQPNAGRKAIKKRDK